MPNIQYSHGTKFSFPIHILGQTWPTVVPMESPLPSLSYSFNISLYYRPFPQLRGSFLLVWQASPPYIHLLLPSGTQVWSKLTASFHPLPFSFQSCDLQGWGIAWFRDRSRASASSSSMSADLRFGLSVAIPLGFLMMGGYERCLVILISSTSHVVPITNSVPVDLVSVFRDLVSNQGGMKG